jgi:hypothetical protein
MKLSLANIKLSVSCCQEKSSREEGMEESWLGKFNPRYLGLIPKASKPCA